MEGQENDIPTMKDHDLLITLVETVRQQHLAVMGKFTDVAKELEDIKTGAAARISDHENRLKKIEQLLFEINLPEITTAVKANTTWITGFKVSWKTMMFTVGVSSAAATFVLTIVVQLLNVLSGRH